MSEPSGDPSNPPSAPPPEAGSTPQNNVTRAPRANPPSVYNPKDAPKAGPGSSGATPGFAEFMSWMQSMGGGGTAEPETPTGRALIPKEQKKFSRRPADPPPTGPAAAENAGPAVSNEEGASTSPAVGGGAAPRAAPPERFNPERKRRPKDAPPKSPVVVILVQLLLFGLIVGSFFLGRATVPRASAPAPVTVRTSGGPTQDARTPGVLPPEWQAKVAEALKAESELNFKRAEALLQEVQRQGGPVYGLTHELALLAYFQGDIPRVLPLLNQSIAKGEEVGASYNLRGTLASRVDGISNGIDDLELSVKYDPFQSRNAFFTGEALRRMGKPQAAVDYLRLAIYTVREPLLEGYYRLKLDLALLDLGREKEFIDDLTAKLALNPPTVDTLFTAAAVEIRRGNASAAAGYLDRARSLTTREQMNLRLQDYYFYGFKEDKLLARFFASVKASSVPPRSLPAAVLSAPGGPTATPALPPPVDMLPTP